MKVLRSVGKHKDAQQALCSALRTHPSSVELWLVRLDAEEGAGQELEQLCREALEQVSGKVRVRGLGKGGRVRLGPVSCCFS